MTNPCYTWTHSSHVQNVSPISPPIISALFLTLCGPFVLVSLYFFTLSALSCQVTNVTFFFLSSTQFSRMPSSIDFLAILYEHKPKLIRASALFLKNIMQIIHWYSVKKALSRSIILINDFSGLQL